MANISLGDAACDRLRTLIETIEGEITQLPASGDGNLANVALHASWSELVKVLALGDKPEMRECPTCHGSGFRAASRCASCWAKLEPLAHEVIAAPIGSLAAAATVTAAPRSQV
ncbi:MAG: hypothetical protein ABIY55_00050 [Kofleriaceae bacterium]